MRNDLSTNELRQKTQSPVDLNSIKITEINQKVLLILQVSFFFLISNLYYLTNSFYFQGLDFLDKLNSSVNMVTNLHVFLKCPMTKQSILSICKLIELLKMVRLTMQEFATEIYNITMCLTQYQIHNILVMIANAQVGRIVNLTPQ